MNKAQKCWQTRGMSLEDRLMFHVMRIPESTCWYWDTSLRNGYGCIGVNGRMLPAHKVAYELFVGAVPGGLNLDHLCRERSCVNPNHLEPVTSKENTHRSPIAIAALNLRKEECPKGHPYTSENVYSWKSGWRACKTCARLRKSSRGVLHAGVSN